MSAMFRYSKQRSEQYVGWSIIEHGLVKLNQTDVSAAAILDISGDADVWGRQYSRWPLRILVSTDCTVSRPLFG